jgi:hypothetical protein
MDDKTKIAGQEYLDKIVTGARQHKLPESYIKK